MTHVKPTLQNKIMKGSFVAHYMIDIQSPIMVNFFIFIIKIQVCHTVQNLAINYFLIF